MSAIRLKSSQPKMDWFKSDPIRVSLVQAVLHYFPGDEDMARLVPPAICEVVNGFGLTDWRVAQAKALEIFDQWIMRHGLLAKQISVNSTQAASQHSGKVVASTTGYQPTPAEVGQMRQMIAANQLDPVIKTR